MLNILKDIFTQEKRNNNASYIDCISYDFNKEECTFDTSGLESDGIDVISDSETERDLDTSISVARQWCFVNTRVNLKAFPPRLPFQQLSGMMFIVQNSEDLSEDLEMFFDEE